MLILTRRPAEKVHMGDHITVTVIEIYNESKVCLRIDYAPTCDCELRGLEKHTTLRIGDTHDIATGMDVTLLELRGNQARIGFNAPRDVSIDRPEIRKRKLLGFKAPSAGSRGNSYLRRG